MTLEQKAQWLNERILFAKRKIEDICNRLSRSNYEHLWNDLKVWNEAKRHWQQKLAFTNAMLLSRRETPHLNLN